MPLFLDACDKKTPPSVLGKPFLCQSLRTWILRYPKKDAAPPQHLRDPGRPLAGPGLTRGSQKTMKLVGDQKKMVVVFNQCVYVCAEKTFKDITTCFYDQTKKLTAM